MPLSHRHWGFCGADPLTMGGEGCEASCVPTSGTCRGSNPAATHDPLDEFSLAILPGDNPRDLLQTWARGAGRGVMVAGLHLRPPLFSHVIPGGVFRQFFWNIVATNLQATENQPSHASQTNAPTHVYPIKKLAQGR